MIDALVTGLRRMALAAPPDERATIGTELDLVLAGGRQCNFLHHDRAAMTRRIERDQGEIGADKTG